MALQLLGQVVRRRLALEPWRLSASSTSVTGGAARSIKLGDVELIRPDAVERRTYARAEHVIAPS